MSLSGELELGSEEVPPMEFSPEIKKRQMIGSSFSVCKLLLIL